MHCGRVMSMTTAPMAPINLPSVWRDEDEPDFFHRDSVDPDPTEVAVDKTYTRTPTWSRLLDEIVAQHIAHPEWRYGQLVFNAVHDLRPDIADRLRGGDLDPFYASGKASMFLNAVYDQWDIAESPMRGEEIE